MNHHEPSWTIMNHSPVYVYHSQMGVVFLTHISSCFSQLTNYAVAGARCCPPKRLRRLRFHHSSGAHSGCLSTKHPAGRRLSCGDAEEPWKKSSAIPSGNHNHYIIKQGNGIALSPSFWFICLMKLKFCRLSAVFLQRIHSVGGCEILHQLVDGLCHYIPIIYSVL